jgi:beta-glucosidase
VAQVYVGVPGSVAVRPVRELKGFASVEIAAGASRAVTIVIPSEDLAYFDSASAAWTVESGDYTVSVGASSRDLRAEVVVSVTGDAALAQLKIDSTLGEWLRHPIGGQILGAAFAQGAGSEMGAMLADPAMLRMAESMPLNRVASFPGSPITPEQLEQLVGAVNAQVVAASGA